MRMAATAARLAVLAVAALVVTPVQARAITFTDSGTDIASITDTVNAFRAALGNPNNGNTAAQFPSGRREINWDGGGPPVINGTPPVTPFTVFTQGRGATFTTPGSGLTQAAATGGLLSLDTINLQYADLFAPFSANRLFAPVGSNITDGFFTIPGTNGTVPAVVRGFGAVFSDVDLLGTTIEYFDVNGASLGVFDVPTATGNQTFSFLGFIVDPGDPLIRSIRIVTGNSALGPNESATVDLVVMDDFLFAEPHGVPLPGSLVLLGMGLLVVAAVSWTVSVRAGR